jgi:hypothetical protein
MKKLSTIVGLFSHVILALLIVGILGSCGEIIVNRKTTGKINGFLKENGWETIKAGTKDEINDQLFVVLQNHDFGRDPGTQDQWDQRQSRIAEFIVETGCYGTARKIISPVSSIINIAEIDFSTPKSDSYYAPYYLGL